MSAPVSPIDYFSSESTAHKLAIKHVRTNNNKPYAYGTSGFRGLAETLPSVCLRMGQLAVLRSISCGINKLNRDQYSIIGVMVTASHNDAPDNGVKLSDPNGEMLDSSWESLCTDLANADENLVCNKLKSICQEKKIHLDNKIKPVVFIGRDTRASSPELANLVRLGAESLGGLVIDWGLVTTPQLHWIVYHANFVNPNVQIKDYYTTLSNAFHNIINITHSRKNSDNSDIKLESLILDCSNGVGSVSMKGFQSLINSVLHVDLINEADYKHLNDNCGAEHVQKTHKPPTNIDINMHKNKKLASLDGDADRLVYYYIDDNGQLNLLDGDKIIALYTIYLQRLLKESNLHNELNIGIVQTAYANGASSIYMKKNLGIEVAYAATGVKHLHHLAKDYDIGVYFEANGHGTIIFNDKAKQAIINAAKDSNNKPANILNNLRLLINQCVGDAISDLLLVECALYSLGWNLQKWNSIYTDLPSAMLKVKVADRSIIKTTNAERTCIEPIGLQDAIDKLVNENNSSGERRSFVRASGTEDIVRVYAEASNRQQCDLLAKQVCDAVFKLAGGIN